MNKILRVQNRDFWKKDAYVVQAAGAEPTWGR